jgi:hypothetical protein
VAIVIAVLCVAGYVFAPKGDNQTFVDFHVTADKSGSGGIQSS